MPTHRFAEGEIVKARPNFLAPRDPSSTRPFSWPFFYPARIINLFGDDGAIVEFLEHQADSGSLDQVTTPWHRRQGYSIKELHALDCGCGTCDPNESLRDPRALIDRLRGDLDEPDARSAEQSSRTLDHRRFPGSLRFLPASGLARGDFLLFPQQHVHAVSESHGDVWLSFCRGAFVTVPAARYLVHQPAHPAPVCDPRSASFDPRYAETLAPSGATQLEQAALSCLADLGLVETAGALLESGLESVQCN